MTTCSDDSLGSSTLAGDAFVALHRPDDLCVAVATLSAVHDIPGSSAYILLALGAAEARLTVREVASMVVLTPGVAEELIKPDEQGVLDVRATHSDS